jgi:hypothetical protein
VFDSSMTLTSGTRVLDLDRHVEEKTSANGRIGFRLPPAPPDDGPASMPNATLALHVGAVRTGEAYCEPSPEACHATVHLTPNHDVFELTVNVE